MNTIIWIIQVVLSIAFLIAGFIKLIMPKDRLREKIGVWVDDFSDSRLKLIGFLEVLGAFGLILPMTFNILPFLTPLAACGILFAMMGAVNLHMKRKESVVTNVVLLLLAALVIEGRLYLLPLIWQK
jgi:putative oxidoreductase